MKTILWLFVFGTAALGTAAGDDLRGNAFFRALTGSWAGKGQLTFENGKSRPMQNRVRAVVDAAGTLFTLEGELTLGEENGAFSAQPTRYRLEIRRSETNPGRFDGRLVNLAEPAEPMRFDVSIDEAAVTAKLVQIPGEGQDRMEISKQVTGNEYLSRTVLYNPAGQPTASAQMKFTREP